MTLSKQQIIIEENRRFSESQIWAGQREYYDQKGIQAWDGDVPFYITSNPFIGNCYARLAMRFIQDWIKLHPNSTQHTFYILELGAGTGQFSFHAMKKLFQLRDTLQMQDIKIKYVMTDFTENNVSFWKDHSAFQSYKEKGLLDYATYDLENDTSITLYESKLTLTSGTTKNPIIVFANYIFDSIVNDTFSIKDTTLKEALISLKTPKNNLNDSNPINWEKVKIDYQENEINDAYYGDNQLDEILFDYTNTLKDTSLLFPIGGLRCLQNLTKISNNKLFMVSSDKGYSSLTELEDLDYPELDFHGSFSVMVNYHAIGNYFKRQQGDCFYQTPRDGLSSAVFTSGFTLENLHETKEALTESVEGFSPSDFFSLYEHMDDTAEEAKLTALTSFLSLSDWDPFIFYNIHSDLIELLNENDASTEIADYLLKNTSKVYDNFYYVPGCDDVYFALGLLHYELDHFKKALEYYHLSEKHFEVSFESVFNIGLCHYYQEDYPAALEYLNKALEFKPRARQVKDLIKKASKKVKTH